MTKIIRSKDCGNSPKNLFAQEFVIAFVAGRVNQIESKVEDEIVWLITSAKTIRGSTKFKSEVTKTKNLAKISVQHVLTHGKLGTVTGSLIDGKGKMKSFCHLIEFSSASATKVCKIVSYKA